MFQRSERLTVLLLLLLAAMLRFYQLDASSLWSDEGNTWALISRSLGEIAQRAAADIHPPGYYWLLTGWSSLWGNSAGSMRSFSALLGTLLVYLTYQIAQSFAPRPTPHAYPLLAAFLAAVNPFQIYYSQEARMYMLLAVEGAALFWAVLKITTKRQSLQRMPGTLSGYETLFYAIYIACGIAGLWTHYSFPILLAAAFVYWFATILVGCLPIRPHLFILLSCHLVILLAFLPWLPTAIDRILHWPTGGATVGVDEGMRQVLQTLAIGPIRSVPPLAWPWLVLAGLLPGIGAWRLRRQPGVWALLLWLLAPIALMVALRLFREAYLKFLLVASPAWVLLVAGVGSQESEVRSQKLGVRSQKSGVRSQKSGLYGLVCNWSLVLLLAGGVGYLAVRSLSVYYNDSAARDNYAGVARYVAALGDPAQDVVLLDAPGQQEVWRYYDPGLPVLALPQPGATAEQTVVRLTQALQNKRQIFALFWGDAEQDPTHTVEHWLDQQAFKGIESWQGNLRLVTYSIPTALDCQPFATPILFANQPATTKIELIESCQPAFPQQLAAGQTALVRLQWKSESVMDRHYKVSVQLLDTRNQVIAQRDSEPGGNSMPTTSWQPNRPVVDNHGILLLPGTPPGDYRLIVALYDAENGTRLVTDQGDFIELGAIVVQRPKQPIPHEIVQIDHRLNAQVGPVLLVGYDLYKQGFAHDRTQPIAAGDLVHLTLYWQAPQRLPALWPPKAQFTLQLGNVTLTAPLLGEGNLPTASWQAGDFLRGEFDIAYDGRSVVPILTVDRHTLHLSPLP